MRGSNMENCQDWAAVQLAVYKNPTKNSALASADMLAIAALGEDCLYPNNCIRIVGEIEMHEYERDDDSLGGGRFLDWIGVGRCGVYHIGAQYFQDEDFDVRTTINAHREIKHCSSMFAFPDERLFEFSLQKTPWKYLVKRGIKRHRRSKCKDTTLLRLWDGVTDEQLSAAFGAVADREARGTAPTAAIHSWEVNRGS
jgi:hypothetical protein